MRVKLDEDLSLRLSVPLRREGHEVFNVRALYPGALFARYTGLRCERGKGALTVCANMWVPGLGFALGHMWPRAIGWFATMVGMTAAIIVAGVAPRLVPALIVLVPLSLALQIAMLIDGYVRGHRAV